MPQPQLRPLQLVALVKDLKDFIILEYELAYYVSTCGLEDKAVDIESGDPGSNPAGVNLFFFFFFFAVSFLSPPVHTVDKTKNSRINSFLGSI